MHMHVHMHMHMHMHMLDGDPRTVCDRGSIGVVDVRDVIRD